MTLVCGAILLNNICWSCITEEREKIVSNMGTGDGDLIHRTNTIFGDGGHQHAGRCTPVCPRLINLFITYLICPA